MNINVVDVLGFESGVLDCELHYRCSSASFGMGCCDVVRVGGETASGKFAEDFGSTCFGVLVLFEDEATAAFAAMYVQ